jgi:phosphatidylserine/phosphatidylglycerophosphate/cardiolipin synthase-like enzyme
VNISDLDQFKAGGAPDSEYPPNMRTFYSPNDGEGVHGALRALLGSAQRSVVVAMYGFDDDELADMLSKQLADPHMYVQITLDRSQAGGVHERAILAKYFHDLKGNSVAIGSSEHGAIMHRKMLIVDGVWRITGSTNWSNSGESLQDNELTVLLSASACAEARHVLDVEHDNALAQMAKRRNSATPAS